LSKNFTAEKKHHKSRDIILRGKKEGVNTPKNRILKHMHVQKGGEGGKKKSKKQMGEEKWESCKILPLTPPQKKSKEWGI
jgi:hypothetical protein